MTKTKTLTRQEVFEGVRDVLVATLGVGEDEIKEEATLTGDLGAESIDFLDIAFRLEKHFGFKLIKGELFPIDSWIDEHFLNDENLSPAGIRFVRGMLPGTDISEFEKDPRFSRVPNLYTVKTLVNFVVAKLGI